MFVSLFDQAHTIFFCIGIHLHPFTKPVTKPVSHLMVCRSSVTRHHKRGSGLARPLRSDVFFDQAHTIFFCIGIHLHPFTKPVTKPVSHLMVCRSSVTRHHKRGSGLARPLRSDVTSGLARPLRSDVTRALHQRHTYVDLVGGRRASGVGAPPPCGRPRSAARRIIITACGLGVATPRRRRPCSAPEANDVSAV